MFYISSQVFHSFGLSLSNLPKKKGGFPGGKRKHFKRKDLLKFLEDIETFDYIQTKSISHCTTQKR